MQRLRRFHFSRAKSLLNFSSKFIDIDFSKKSNKELYNYLTKYDKLYFNLTLYTCIGIIGSFAIEDVIEPYLKKKLIKIGKENKYGEYLSILTYHGGKSWKNMEAGRY